MPEELQPGQTTETLTEPTLDVESTVADIAESLHLAEAEPADEPAAVEGDEPAAKAEGGDQPKAEGAGKPAGEEGAPAAQPVDADKIPSTWRKEAKEAWAALPPVVREEVAKREGDIARFVTEVQTPLRIAKGFESILSPYQAVLQKYNINPYQHVASLLEGSARLMLGTPEVKAETFRQLAKDVGIDLKALADGTPQQENPNAEYTRRLEARIAQLEQGVHGVASTVNEARLSELTQSVLAYAQDTEAHPFFDEVADDIKHLIDTKAVGSLDEAYQMAVLRNPQTRQKILDRDLAKRKADDEKAAAEHAEKAKKAIKGMPKSSVKGRASAGPETVDQTLAKTLAKINSRDAA